MAIQHTACGCRTIMITTNCDLDTVLVLKSLICYIASPLFVNQNGDPLTKIWIYFGIKHVQICIGCNVDVYNGHSFRIGTAINATSVHVEDHIIKVLGSWSSDVYCRYIRTPPCTTFLSITEPGINLFLVTTYRPIVNSCIVWLLFVNNNFQIKVIIITY